MMIKFFLSVIITLEACTRLGNCRSIESRLAHLSSIAADEAAIEPSRHEILSPRRRRHAEGMLSARYAHVMGKVSSRNFIKSLNAGDQSDTSSLTRCIKRRFSRKRRISRRYRTMTVLACARLTSAL